MATRTSGESTSTTSFQPNIIPENLQALIDQAISNISDVQQRFPLMSLLKDLAQQVVPLTPLELKLLGQQVATSQGPAVTQPELGALSDINQLIGGPIGSSPSTLAALQAFRQLQAPQIAQNMALAGQTQGGGYAETMANAETGVLAPLLQQEMQQRVSVLPSLAGIGATVADRERNDMSTALGASGLPRQVAQAQSDSNWQDVMRRAGIIQAVNTGAAAQFAPLVVTPGAQTTTGNSFSKVTQPGIWSSLGKKTVILLAKSLLAWHVAAQWVI